VAVSAPAATVGAARGPWIASVALAVAIVVAAGLAVLTLVTAPSSSATATASGSATQPDAATAPASGAPAPGSVAAAPASPAAVPPPAGAPATADSAGRALPAAVGTGVQALYTALGTGDLAGVEARYSPSTTVDAAAWSEVGPLLAQPANRDALLAALREPPQRQAALYRFSAAGGARVGVDAQGRMAFVRLP